VADWGGGMSASCKPRVPVRGRGQWMAAYCAAVSLAHANQLPLLSRLSLLKVGQTPTQNSRHSTGTYTCENITGQFVYFTTMFQYKSQSYSDPIFAIRYSANHLVMHSVPQDSAG